MRLLLLVLVAAAPLRYALDAPARAVELPPALTELSDLSSADGDSLWAVDDEQGALFRISVRNGAVLETVPFGGAGDFEAVAMAGGVVFAGRSDGALFAVEPQTGKAELLKTALPRDCDLEGLAYDPAGKRLLASCKRPQGTKAKRSWPIWAIELATRTLSSEPALSISRQAIEAWRQQHPAKGLKHADEQLDPSGLAVHPKTGHLYLVSARGHALVVLAGDGTLLALEPLPAERFPQPEAIAFLPDGTLVIGNEARNGEPARLLVYRAP